MVIEDPPEYGSPIWSDLTGQRPEFYEGLDIYHFLTNVDRWVHRRVEQIEFLDDRSVRRKVSVDIELPSNEPEREVAGKPMDLVPLALLRKEPLVGFDLRDENGGTVPLLTRQQNAFVSWSLLAAVGEAAARNAGFSLPLPLDVLSDLRLLTSERADKAERALKTFKKPRRQDSRPLRKALMRDEVFSSFAEALADNFLLLVLLEHQPSGRRVLKFSYVEPLPWPLLRPRASLRHTLWLLRVRLGLASVPLDFEVPALNEAASYHFEIEAPRGLMIESAEIADEGSGAALVDVPNPRGARVHLYAASTIESSEGIAWIWLRPTVTGLIRISALFTFAVAALLALIASRSEAVRAGTSMGLLLAIPGFLAIFIVRPGEHLLASRILLGIRSVVVGAGLLPMAGALGLLLKVPKEWLSVMWWVLAILATGLAVLVARSHSAAKLAAYPER